MLPMWVTARKVAQLSLPLADEGWYDQLFITHIVPVRTQDPYHYWLYFHLTFAGFTVFPVSYPTVPKGQTRLKVTFHSNNTEEQVDKLADSIFEFVAELANMQDNGSLEHGVPSAARSVYDWMAGWQKSDWWDLVVSETGDREIAPSIHFPTHSNP
jgi:8-amino-7-oxononanoate synthase